MCCVGNRAKHLKDPRDASTDTHMQQQRGENLFRPSRVTGFSELGSLRKAAKVFYINLFKSLTKRFLCSVSTFLRIKAGNICGMYDIWVTEQCCCCRFIMEWTCGHHFAAVVIIDFLLNLYDSFGWNVVTAGGMDCYNRSEAESLT